jgi:glycosyltransferase involved in cell wall biosynthesis
MPVFNGAGTVSTAIDSLLQQTFPDLEVVVVDDGSTDGTASVLARYRGDSRFNLVAHAHNLGLVPSLSDGLAAAKGELVARLDADDVALPARIEHQVAAFDADPELVLCATAYERVHDMDLAGSLRVPPLEHAALAMAFYVGNQLCHSAVMYRRAAVLDAGGYDAAWFPVEDYDLWLRLLDRGRYRGLDHVGVRYLENESGISAAHRGPQQDIMELRAIEYRRSVAGDGIGDSPRSVARFHRRVRAKLRARGMDAEPARVVAYRLAFAATAGRPRLVRHAMVLWGAPALWLSARLKRV